MQDRYPLAKKGADNLRQNRIWLARAEGIDANETDHNPPSGSSEQKKIHYTAAYYWDEVAADIVSAKASLLENDSYDYLDAAKRGLGVLAAGIHDDGFLPNYRYLGKPRGFDPEMILAFEKGATSSNYTQPPVLALGVYEAYKASKILGDNPDQFLSDIYPGLSRHYDYLERELSNSGTDKLMGVYHPHMTGRDADPTFDSLKPLRLPRRGPDTPKIIDKLNIPIDYASILWHGIRLKKAGDSVEQWRKVYWMNDVMMNCMYVDNLRKMTTLASEQSLIFDAKRYGDLANTVENQILNNMWFPDARDGRGVFAGLDKNGEPIGEVSISNLFPLALDNLREEQLESILGLMDQSFDTPYPLPSVSTDSPNYDPHNHESWRLWRGPKWMITDWYIVELGLWRQVERPDLSHRPDLIDRCVGWAHRIAEKSLEVVEENGLREHYNPITGKGQRERVKNFGWSNLAYIMKQSS